MKYQMGDIVWASEAISKEENENKTNVKNHFFIIIDDDGKVVPIDYLGLVVSSRTDKSKENSPFKYNEPLYANECGLKNDGIVKCDQLMEIPASNISRKVGELDADVFSRFLDAFENYLKEELGTN